METKRLIIRPFLPTDGEDLWEYLSDPEVVKFEPYPPYTRPQAEREAARRAQDGDFWAVCLKDGGKLIGNLYFHRDDPAQWRNWELGYVLNRRFQRQGYAAEAALELLRYGFETLDCRRIAAFCNPQNEPSWKLLERIGMRREGHFLQQGFFKRDGDNCPIWHDAYAYAVLESEWWQRNPCRDP